MHVVVIGGGVIGLTTAYHLLREGASVTLVDARQTGLGASDVNAGWIVPADSAPLPGPSVILPVIKWMFQPDSPVYVRLSLKPDVIAFLLTMFRSCLGERQRNGFKANLEFGDGSLPIFDEYIKDGLDFELQSNGLLLAYLEKENFDNVALLKYSDLLARYGLEPKALVGDEVRDFEPHLSDDVYGGLYFPKERHLDPGAFVRALYKRVAELGGEIVQNAPIDHADVVHGRVQSVSSRGRMFTADKFVLAAGAWTGKLSKLFGYSLPIRAGKGYCVDVDPYDLRTIVNLSDANVAVTPMKRNLRLAGTMELAGLDENINQVRVDAIMRAPARYFRDWEPPKKTPKAQAGMRPMSADGGLVVGPLGSLENLIVASGHGMFGVTLAPATGRAVTDLVMHNRMNPVMTNFFPSRFHGGR
jgi:D-amino-acid dehydrogenase